MSAAQIPIIVRAVTECDSPQNHKICEELTMSQFEILCVTMHQTDFSKLEQMNIHSDVFFANQADRTAYEELKFEGHTARMLTTDTRGVGVNRNMTLQYAKGDICLFADDDVTYCDDMEAKILGEFATHPDADIIIFHVDAGETRKQISYPKTKRCRGFFRMPWGAVRIAFRLEAVKKANLWFTTLFGGGCIFSSGEDSMWLHDARKKGLCFYVSRETIGSTDVAESSWFTGYDEKFFYGKGAGIAATHGSMAGLWIWYYLFRYRKAGQLAIAEKKRWMRLGRQGYDQMRPYETYQNKQ